LISRFTPASPVLRRDAFDHPDYLIELKHDGFRALAYVDWDGTRLVSRRGNTYRSFPRLCDAVAQEIRCEAVLVAEIVCLDSEGQPQFYELLRRRGAPVLYVFDVLWLDGEDLRERPLIERKRLLRSLVPERSSALLYADHIAQHGVEFFRLACDRDLEGVVAKSRYGEYGQSWWHIRNPNYSQYEGRHELFEKRSAGVGEL
jgi:bifunctional non-homologous end joining protein LigD